MYLLVFEYCLGRVVYIYFCQFYLVGFLGEREEVEGILDESISGVIMSCSFFFFIEIELEEIFYIVDRIWGQKGSGLFQSIQKDKDSVQKVLGVGLVFF